MDALIPFTTSGSLVDLVDSGSGPHGNANAAEKVLVVLRDGKKLIGVLRSYDQFGESRAMGARERET